MPGSALEHPGKNAAGGLNRRLEVDAEGPGQIVFREPLEAAVGREARVGDQRVDRLCLGGQARGGSVLGEVGDDRAMAFAGQRLREPFELVAPSGAEHEARPSGRENLGDRVAQAAGGAGEEHALAAKLHARKLSTGIRCAER